MINKKLSGLFLRKDKPKQQPKPVPEFDESFFHCKLISKNINTDLIRIQTQLKQTGEPLDEIKCKWYIKNSKDFKQIQDVNSSYYQPCLDDVGSIICVQMEPHMEGKKYNGITIMEETQIIEIDNELETQLDNFLEQKSIKMEARIQAIYSQNPKYEQYEFPLEVKIQIVPSKIVLLAGDEEVEMVSISQEYPIIEFIRKTFCSILFNYNEKESMKLSLMNNSSRDLFALIVRTCAAHSQSFVDSNPQDIKFEEEKVNRKEEEDKIEEKQDDKVEKKQKQQQQEIVTEQISLKQTSPQQQQNSNKTKSNKSAASPVVSSTQSLEACTPKQKKQQKSPSKSSTLFVLKLDEANKQLKTIKRKYEQLSHEYKIQKTGKYQAETQLQTLKKALQSTKRQRDEAIIIAKKVKQLKEDNRFYKNEIIIIKQELKEQKHKNHQLQKQIQANDSNANIELENKLFLVERQLGQVKLIKEIVEKKAQQCEFDLEKYKEQLQKINNENVNLRKKIQSLANEKGIKKTFNATQQPSTQNRQSEQRIKELEMKLKNLQMLLKYKSSQGDNSSNFQLLVNKLTETITEKELQMNDLRKINKNLLEQLKDLREQVK